LGHATVLRKKGPTAAQAKSKQAILAAQRRGEDVETSKKWAAGQNKQHSITKNTAKLDRETEELHHDRVTLEVGKVIPQGRQSKGLMQTGQATKINEKPQVIADYEGGRAIPKNQVLGKIESHRPQALGESHWEANREGAEGEMNTKPRNQCIPADLVCLVPLDHQCQRGSLHAATRNTGR
ncbi:endothelial differentiation-related factor 1-like, partial [Lagenorhynchus albirostris]|uniref:endothelial differentiation-related factor 1-like n=1 Tax=Lagenorhynchus albirostris TaxID=27610 RepID=UPI0028E9D340